MACTPLHVACIGGYGRFAVLQILAVVLATAAVCALQPIPFRRARFPLRGMQDILKPPPALCCGLLFVSVGIVLTPQSTHP